MANRDSTCHTKLSWYVLINENSEEEFLHEKQNLIRSVFGTGYQAMECKSLLNSVLSNTEVRVHFWKRGA